MLQSKYKARRRRAGLLRRAAYLREKQISRNEHPADHLVRKHKRGNRFWIREDKGPCDPNSGDTLKYDVYFSITSPILVSQNQSDTYFDPYGTNDMPLFEEYYWRIVTWDREGESTSGPIWSFKTGINPPPTNPK